MTPKTTSIRAALYGRKSTDQNVEADAKSVTRQSELARAFATRKGWTVVAEYTDDGVSGRRRSKLISRNKMLAAAMNSEFSVLVVRDLDRLSRDDEELPGLIYTLRDAGVEVWCYSDGQRVDTKTALSRLMLNVKSYSGTAETEKASERTREQKRSRYAKTANVDGKVYGYVNVGEAKQRRRETEPKQAKVIRRIFEMSASGLGLLKIVQALNHDKIPSPTGRDWCVSGVREMLHRELYRGVSVYGKTRWEWRDKDKFKIDVPEKDWLRVPAPELRIVPEDLWKRVHARQERTRETYPGRKKSGQLQGRREAGLVSQYLLSGFLRCGCGGNLIVTTRSGKRGATKRYWVCTTAHHRRGGVCDNVKGIPYEPLTQAIVETFKANLLNPNALGQLLMRELQQHTAAPDAAKAEAETLRRDIAKLDREIARALEIALAGSGEVSAVAEALRAKEREKATLQARLEHADGLQRAAEGFDVVAWMEETAELLADTRNLLEADPAAGRQILRRCLPGPLTVTPDGAGGWTYEGVGHFMVEDLGNEVRRVQGRVGSAENGPQNPPPPKMVPPG